MKPIEPIHRIHRSTVNTTRLQPLQPQPEWQIWRPSHIAGQLRWGAAQWDGMLPDVARFEMFDVSWDFETGSSAEMVTDQSVGISWNFR